MLCQTLYRVRVDSGPIFPPSKPPNPHTTPCVPFLPIPIKKDFSSSFLPSLLLGILYTIFRRLKPHFVEDLSSQRSDALFIWLSEKQMMNDDTYVYLFVLRHEGSWNSIFVGHYFFIFWRFFFIIYFNILRFLDSKVRLGRVNSLTQAWHITLRGRG